MTWMNQFRERIFNEQIKHKIYFAGKVYQYNDWRGQFFNYDKHQSDNLDEQVEDVYSRILASYKDCLYIGPFIDTGGHGIYGVHHGNDEKSLSIFSRDKEQIKEADWMFVWLEGKHIGSYKDHSSLKDIIDDGKKCHDIDIIKEVCESSSISYTDLVYDKYDEYVELIPYINIAMDRTVAIGVEKANVCDTIKYIIYQNGDVHSRFDIDAYGTIMEIGIANALNIPIYLAHDKHLNNSELWFVYYACTDVVSAVSPSNGFHKLYKKHFDDTLGEIKTFVKPHVRKLPIGHNASNNARKLADHYGFKI